MIPVRFRKPGYILPAYVQMPAVPRVGETVHIDIVTTDPIEGRVEDVCWEANREGMFALVTLSDI